MSHMSQTDIIIFSFAILVIIVSILCMVYRIMKGPHAPERLNALFVIGTTTTLFLLFIGFVTNQIDFYVDIAITYAIIGFVALVVFAKYLLETTPYQQEEGEEEHENS